jgi:hypothetical protein
MTGRAILQKEPVPETSTIYGQGQIILLNPCNKSYSFTFQNQVMQICSRNIEIHICHCFEKTSSIKYSD